MTDRDGFWIAAFAAEGELLGKELMPLARLSPKWLAVWRRVLHDHPSTFDGSVGEGLSHLRTKFAAAPGAALVTQYANGHIASSSIYLKGVAAADEEWLLSQFRGSLLRTSMVNAASGDRADAFAALATLSERPVAMVVVWGNPKVSPDDHELIKELEWHLAGSFLSQADA
jgi:hypothetical protein